MARSKTTSLVWIAVGLLGAMVICLCLFLAIAISLISMNSPAEPTPISYEPTAVPLGTTDTVSLLSSVEVPQSDPVDIAERLLGLEDVPRTIVQEAESISIGTVREFWNTDMNSTVSELIEARLVYKGEVVYFWVDTRVDVDLEDVERIVTNFENISYQTVRDLVGEEWSPGVDGDHHLYILYSRELGPSVAGYFFPKDEYSPLVYEQSNGHEMFYISADGVDLSSNYIESVLAHEFQHMVHWNVDRNEETWVNEGFSELVEIILGYEIGGFDYLFTQKTDIPLLHWPAEPGTAGQHYGQVFLFMTYLYDRFGWDFMHALAVNTSNGLEALDQTLEELDIQDPYTGQLLAADAVFLDWSVSLALQDPDLADGRYGLQSYSNPPMPFYGDDFDRCPIQVAERSVTQYGIDLIKIECGGDFTLEFSGQRRTKVISGEPHSGDFTFWSNEGDESDMTLTRSFDFREISGPILFDYWVWYEIEDSYDYLYLEASVDEGQTWQILRTPSGTEKDPTGHAFGWGYTGISGGGSSPIWIKESVDLSRFAGQEIILRFEYITDTAVNTEGLLLDDLSISAIGYEENFEGGDGGWKAEGFVRLLNQIPQTYRLALIERGDEISVREVVLDAENRAKITLQFGDTLEEAVLVVTATSRFSWLPANYTIQIVR
jgi:immune inhibitor A